MVGAGVKLLAWWWLVPLIWFPFSRIFENLQSIFFWLIYDVCNLVGVGGGSQGQAEGVLVSRLIREPQMAANVAIVCLNFTFCI